MKHHKVVNEKVVAANRSNAQKSTGPVTPEGKAAVRHNAVRHGLLAKQILLRQDESQQDELKAFLDGLESSLAPVGVIERMLVEEIGACWWKLGTATKLALSELHEHRLASQHVVTQLQQPNSTILDFDEGAETGVAPFWGCDRLVMRRNKGTAERKSKPADASIFDQVPSVNQDRGSLEIEVSLSSPLPTILRYEAGLKRDYYRALHTLNELQRIRKDPKRNHLM